ncbi:MAG: CPBP family intramembrane metalloprotease [Bacteroidia bacterium]|nr:CPBP family intramembrane metalloprotease [Bacteroidia bacterium]
MKKGFLSGIPGISKFALAVCVVIVTFIVFVIIGFALGMMIFKINLLNAPSVFSDFSNPQNIALLKYFQAVQSVGLFVAPPFIIALMFDKTGLSYLRFNIKIKLLSFIASVLIMIAAIPLINALMNINSHLALPDFLSKVELYMKDAENKAQLITQAFLNVNSLAGLAVNLLIIAVIPAIGEELLFRGVFQRIFIEWTKNVHVGILIASVLFSAFHLQFYGFLPRMMMGVALGYMLVWSGSIWLPVAAHFINNAAAVILSYLVNVKILSPDIETLGMSQDSLTFVILSILTVAGFLFSIYLQEKRKREPAGTVRSIDYQ